MKRTRILGLCFGLALALAAVGATGAQAAEYGRCLKAKKVDRHLTGGYANENCTQTSATSEGGYEWYPWGSGPQPQNGAFKAHAAGEGAILESAAGKLDCTGGENPDGNRMSGEITGATAGTTDFVLHECTSVGDEAETGIFYREVCDTPGAHRIDEIDLAVDTGLAQSGEEVLTEYSGGEPFVELWCEGGINRARITGTLGAATTENVNEMTKESSFAFSIAAGGQNLELEYSTDRGASWGAPEPLTFRSEFIAAYREKVEIRTSPEPIG
jgi:hypothetical protein